MNKLFCLFLAAGVLLTISGGCDKTPPNIPNIIFKIDGKKVNKDTIVVPLNSSQVLYVETTGPNPMYFRQKNDEQREDLNGYDDLTTIEYTSSTEYSHSKREIHTTFSDVNSSYFN